MVQISGSFKDGKRIAGVNFHKRFIEKLEEQIQQMKKEEGVFEEEKIFLDYYIPCSEENPDAKYLSGYIYIYYTLNNKEFVERCLLNRIHQDIPDDKIQIIKHKSKLKNIEEDNIKENDAVRIIEEGDFYGFDGRISKLDKDFCEVIVTIFNQDCIVKVEKTKVQKISNNIENYSLKILR